MGTYLYIKDYVEGVEYTEDNCDGITESPMYYGGYNENFTTTLFTDVFKGVEDPYDYFAPTKVSVETLQYWFKALCIYGVKSYYPYQPEY